MMKLIVGLGNPGKQYEMTRHNVGFLCVDALVAKVGAGEFSMQKKFEAEIAEATFEGEKIIIAKPHTFMNVSGKSVSALYNFYQCAPSDLLVAYDDIDLAFNELRLRPSGSAGSHNGMKSIIASLGFENFPRLRIGIESREEEAKKNQELGSFVLARFAASEKKTLGAILERASEAIIMTLQGNIAKAMDTYNRAS